MDTNTQENNQELVAQEVVEPEAPEVVEEVNPLVVRVVLHEGSPLEFIVHNAVQGQFREWIAQNVASQANSDGTFIGSTYIPNSKIKYFEEA
ncbi:hypothetical protein CN984_12195 [Bacillus cereus]|uniref:Uncharacterized protein n=1 Tax=Bacillus cereus TaxID=1396 RepID=A0A2A7FP55_BACCE|nr:hypothetical protein [Bacillus cereus]PEA25821.1 hypothetical protein CON44_17900 [Bacillus cereus]PGO29198.1 hypothetical protein CN984_12195 [Bacillus cereus]